MVRRVICVQSRGEPCLALGCALAPHPHPNWQALDASSSSSSSSSESMNSSGHWDESCSVYSSSHAVVSRTLGSVPASRAGPVGSAAPCRSFLPGLGTNCGPPGTDTPPRIPSENNVPAWKLARASRRHLARGSPDSDTIKVHRAWLYFINLYPVAVDL